MRKVDAEAWAGLVMLAVLLALGLPVLTGAVSPELPRLWWSVIYVVTVVALVIAALNSEPGRSPVPSRVALAVATVGSTSRWTTCATAWTPRSVRPAQVVAIGWPRQRDRAPSRVPCTVV